MSNLYFYYKNYVIDNLIKKFNYKSIMQVPNIYKIVINVGINSYTFNKNFLNQILNDLSLISGQKPIILKAKKSVAGFKIRKGDSVGCKVTLRNQKMWDFLERFICISVPRIRDFRGFSLNSFDGKGNYNIGIIEQIIFPEINYDVTNKIFGMNISIITNTFYDYISLKLLKLLRFPFQKK